MRSLLPLLAVATVGALAALPAAAQTTAPPLNVARAAEALGKRRPPADLEASLRAWLGGDLKKGTLRTDDTTAVFAIEIEPGEPEPKAVASDAAWSLPLKRIGKSNLWAATTKLASGTAFRWSFVIGERRVGGGELEVYDYPAETKAQPGVPQGQLLPQAPHKSEVFAGTTRDWWIYVPAQYDPQKPACVLVVQDGQWSRGYWPPVLDNLIAKKDIPVTIAIFLKPGTKTRDIDNRSVEYDTVSDAYARFLLEEILPEVGKRYNLRQDARGRMITGISSGGICAFTAAWERPDAFHKVLSWVGSFTNLQGGPTGVAGGNTYPAILRRRAGWDRQGIPKPIRVYLQDGERDLDNAAGSWPLANRQMAAALAFGGYDFQFVMGQGFHSDRQGRALLPEAMRWLWRDEPKP